MNMLYCMPHAAMLLSATESCTATSAIIQLTHLKVLFLDCALQDSKALGVEHLILKVWIK